MKIKSKLKLFLITALAIAINIIPVCSLVSADDSNSKPPTATISPVLEKITLQPGSKYRSSLRLANTGGSALEYKVYAKPYGISADDQEYSNPSYSELTDYSTISKWIKIDEEDTTGSLESLGETEINYTIDVPEDAAPGGQYAAIIVERTNNAPTGATNASVTSIPRTAFLVYATVAGQANNSGSVSQNSISTFFFNPPITATSLVENTGNVHSDAEYILQVFPLFSDEEAYTNEEEPMTKTILPETRRFVTQSWDGAPSLGIFKVKQTVKFAGNESVTEKIVIICPMWLVFLVIFGVVFLIVYLIARSKMRKGSSSSKPAHSAPAA